LKNVGGCFFDSLFPKLDRLFNQICQFTEIFNQITDDYFKAKNEDEKKQQQKQKEFNDTKKSALNKFRAIVQSENDLDFLLGIAPVQKYVVDKTGLDKLDIDDLFIAYYQLLLK